MAFLLYHRSSRPTGQILGQALGIDHGMAAPDTRLDVLIRWGSQSGVPYRPTNSINMRDAIGRATDKLTSLGAMRESGVPTPNFAENPAILKAPLLGRNRSHTRGSDIVLCMQLSDTERADREYFVEYVPTNTEYRVHVFNNRIIRVAEKVLTNPDDACAWIRNHEHGYTFRRPRGGLGALQEAIAVQAVAAHRLTFGAVDMILGDDGQTYVLEVNTAPACSPRTGRAYVEAMVEHLTGLGAVCNPNYEALEALRANNADDIDE